MAFESVDQLQKALTRNVFSYAKDSKKATGRALGTIVEIMTFYLLKSWGLNNSISIEKRIPEFGNPDITHNVEYSLHPIYNEYFVELPNDGKSLTAHRILAKLSKKQNIDNFQRLSNNLLTRNGILRNGCAIASNDNSYLVASINDIQRDTMVIAVTEQSIIPYAIFECKRVGVEEGTKKGPQTIEKAKQGAYVAKSVSSLQKMRLEGGELYGIIYQNNEVLYSKPYPELLEEVINSDNPDLLRYFIMTIGVVSNHGNWFTAEDHNKELKVLAQSYDWLLFLTDEGLTEFIEEVIFNPTEKYKNIKDAFTASYTTNKKKNQFTKVQMNMQADAELLEYFRSNIERIESWFNVIAPKNNNLTQLKTEIHILQEKEWEDILK
ncbi:MAG: hypothetical protein DIAAKJNI_00430 [Candidatus Argoarchaeum ethanivorans]|uniref:Uncharacterized protein n=1 Tax=Candidatus Argoarchaeum ethanivorans TaxID=2608793 RepID=A0A811TBM5_9EURY|nr:MAG: hypothetical protein DIAAKJNI_00430 [Candidatus Argoarchaeum ethanivorans]